MTERLRDWLEISTEGFAQRQLDRPPAHLVKELLQNALDATEGLAGAVVTVTVAPYAGDGGRGRRRSLLTEVRVSNTGPSITDPRDLRTVFSSGKEESFTLRGRMGQGLKEVLCLARGAECRSGRSHVRWHIVDGERVTDIDPLDPPVEGSHFRLWMAWPATEISAIVEYLQTMLAPEGRTVRVNHAVLQRRAPVHVIDVRLRTEVFEQGRWARRERPGQVEIVPLLEGESPRIYELGIPIQPLDWTQRYHLNVLMRVPMNPRRDAVETGYLKRLYAQVLPVLLPSLEPQALRDEWVSEAIEATGGELRQAVVRRAFGEKAVRSVPTMGRHDWDADARELGFQPIDTGLLPKGLREAAAETLPSSRTVEIERRESIAEAALTNIERDQDAALIACYGWLGLAVLKRPITVRIVPTIVIHGERKDAAWNSGGVLLLSETARPLWRQPFSEAMLGLLAHEFAHDLAAHHGDDFRRAVEQIAGRLARVMLTRAQDIGARFHALGAPAPTTHDGGRPAPAQTDATA